MGLYCYSLAFSIHVPTLFLGYKFPLVLVGVRGGAHSYVHLPQESVPLRFVAIYDIFNKYLGFIFL